MLSQKILDDISQKIGALMKQTPAADLEKNLRAMLQSAFAKLDLVTREESPDRGPTTAPVETIIAPDMQP
jgi:BMFP domain-containing protein YqiC